MGDSRSGDKPNGDDLTAFMELSRPVLSISIEAEKPTKREGKEIRWFLSFSPQHVLKEVCFGFSIFFGRSYSYAFLFSHTL